MIRWGEGASKYSIKGVFQFVKSITTQSVVTENSEIGEVVESAINSTPIARLSFLAQHIKGYGSDILPTIGVISNIEPDGVLSSISYSGITSTINLAVSATSEIK